MQDLAPRPLGPQANKDEAIKDARALCNTEGVEGRIEVHEFDDADTSFSNPLRTVFSERA